MSSRSGSPGPEVARSGDRFYVVSGCSGSGKSTLIAALAERGEVVVPEPGRRVVREQLAVGGDGLPWANPQRFMELCAETAIRDFDHMVAQRHRAFFDRSLLDVACAVHAHDMIAPEGLESAVESKRYARLAFMSPPWEALFRPDAERRHTFAEAVAEYDALLPTYRRLGYEVVLLPLASVEERVTFVLSTVRDAQQ